MKTSPLAITMRRPLGVIAAIVPFNYPVELWSHKVAGGLAAGNAVITKTPEDCPLAILEVAKYLEEAGLPAGAHQVLTGGRDVGEALVRSPGVQMIAKSTGAPMSAMLRYAVRPCTTSRCALTG